MFWKKKKPDLPKRTFESAPLPDITAYELACLLRYFTPNVIVRDKAMLKFLPPECLRHVLVNGQRLHEVAEQLKNEPQYQ